MVIYTFLQFICCCSHSLCNGKSEALIRARYGLYASEYFSEAPSTVTSSPLPDSVTHIEFPTVSVLPFSEVTSAVNQPAILHEISSEQSGGREDHESSIHSTIEAKIDSGEKSNETLPLQDGVDLTTDATEQTEAITQPIEGTTIETPGGSDSEIETVLEDTPKEKSIEQVDLSTASSVEDAMSVTENPETDEVSTDASVSKSATCSDASSGECRENITVAVGEEIPAKESGEVVSSSTAHSPGDKDDDNVATDDERKEVTETAAISTEHIEDDDNVTMSSVHTDNIEMKALSAEEHDSNVTSSVEHKEHDTEVAFNAERNGFIKDVTQNVNDDKDDEVMAESGEFLQDDEDIESSAEEIKDDETMMSGSGYSGDDADVLNGEHLDDDEDMTVNDANIINNVDVSTGAEHIRDDKDDGDINVTSSTEHVDDRGDVIFSAEKIKDGDNVTSSIEHLEYTRSKEDAKDGDEVVSSVEHIRDDNDDIDNVTSSTEHVHDIGDMALSADHIKDYNHTVSSLEHEEDTEKLVPTEEAEKVTSIAEHLTLNETEAVVGGGSQESSENVTVLPSVRITDVTAGGEVREGETSTDSDSIHDFHNISEEIETTTAESDRGHSSTESVDSRGEESFVTSGHIEEYESSLEASNEHSTRIYNGGILTSDDDGYYDDSDFQIEQTTISPYTSPTYSEDSSHHDIESFEQVTRTTEPSTSMNVLLKSEELQEVEPDDTESYTEVDHGSTVISDSNAHEYDSEVEQLVQMPVASISPVTHDTATIASATVQAVDIGKSNIGDDDVVKEKSDSNQQEIHDDREVNEREESTTLSPRVTSVTVSRESNRKLFEKQAKLYEEKKSSSWKSGIIPWWVIVFITILVAALLVGIIYRTVRKRFGFFFY